MGGGKGAAGCDQDMRTYSARPRRIAKPQAIRANGATPKHRALIIESSKSTPCVGISISRTFCKSSFPLISHLKDP